MKINWDLTIIYSLVVIRTSGESEEYKISTYKAMYRALAVILYV